MKHNIFTTFVLALFTVAAAPAATIVYDNTTSDTGGAVFYSTGNYQQIGDVVTLGGTDRVLTGATVQFYNNAEANGTFSAILRFWNPGAPVGSLLGSSQLDGVSISGFDVVTASFGIANLSLPEILVATVQILKASAGMDLGITLFDTPAVGSSDNTYFIVNSDGMFDTGQTPAGSGNLNLSLQATSMDLPPDTSTPEPSSGVLAGGIVLLAVISRHAQRRGGQASV